MNSVLNCVWPNNTEVIVVFVNFKLTELKSYCISFVGSVGETTLQLLSQEEVEEHGLQTVTMSNDGTTGGTTIVQYAAHGSEGQIFIPGMFREET